MPLPITLKAPSDHREVWRGGVLQIMVTRACDLSCVGCTQGSNLAGKPVMMTPQQFDWACESLRGYTGVVGVFGGNPCLHPDFDELCSILSYHFPKEQRGLWSNNLMGKGEVCAETFNPEVSNLNVHGKEDAFLEMMRTWPDSKPKGLMDSRHAPPFVALKDLEDLTDGERWGPIEDCDVNRYWSALIGVFRGNLRGWFCELAGAQSMLHEKESDYPDTGVKVVPGWWKEPIETFERQVRKHCLECGIPLKARGDLSQGTLEEVSPTHLPIYTLKKTVGKTIKLVRHRSELHGTVPKATDYIENGQL